MRNATAGWITRRGVIGAAGTTALGKLLPLSASAEEALRTLAPVGTIGSEPDGLSTIKLLLSLDGRTMLTVSSLDAATIWDVRASKLVRHLETKDMADATLAADGKTACTADKQTIFFWNLADGRTTRTIKPDGGDIRAIAATPDGRSLVVAQRQSLSIWDLRNGTRGKVSDQTNTGFITGLMLSPDGKRSYFGAARVYALPSLDLVAEWSFGINMGGVALSADGRLLLVGDDELVSVFDTVAKQRLARIATPKGAIIQNIAVFRDGKRFAATYSSDNIGRFMIGNLAKNAFVAQSEVLYSYGPVALSPDQRQAYVALQPITIYDVAGVS